MEKRIITISREFGSGGRFIGEEVAKKLGIAYYDKNIISQIAEKSGLSPEYIQESAELSPKKGLLAYALAGRDITGKSVEDMVYEVQRKGILELAEKDFETVSDGQRQRVLLARAICQEPQVIVLDEPTAFLDIRHKLELLYLLKNMVREKKVAVLMSLHELDLAQKISDHIICVKGDNSIGRFGTPEEIFSGDYISDYGSVELEAVKGEPKVFVIGGNGTGIPVYRQLQKEGIPFAAGILWENDREYPVAEALASVVIREKAFESVSDATFETAVKVLKNCEKVICCMENFGTYQEPCRQLWKIAKDLGKI